MRIRFEVGGEIPSPQQPREQRSRFSALPSRVQTFSHDFPQRLRQRWNQPNRFEQQLSQKLAEAAESSTERFRTNYDALLATVAQELTDVVFRLPENRFSPAADDPLYVIKSTGNGVKGDEIARLLAPHPVILESVPDAEEIHAVIPIVDAASKTTSAEEKIQTDPQYANLKTRLDGKPYVIVANDVVNATVSTEATPGNPLHHVHYERVGKPERLHHLDGLPFTLDQQLESVRQTFQGLSEYAQDKNAPYVPYLAEIATVIHNPKDPEHDALSTQKTVMFLSREKLAHLADPKGFAEYLYRIGQHNLNLTKIAGGFELDVLREMGVISFITGSPEDIRTHQRLLAENPSNPYPFPPQRDEAIRHASRIVLGHVDDRLMAAFFGSTNEPNEGIKN